MSGRTTAKKKVRSGRNGTSDRNNNGDEDEWGPWTEWEWNHQKHCYMRTRQNSKGLPSILIDNCKVLIEMQCRRL